MTVSLETIRASVKESRKALNAYVTHLLEQYAVRQVARRSNEIPVVMFVGHGRAGKDESAQILASLTKAEYGKSTSAIANPMVAHSLGVPPEVAWSNRHNDRMYWKAWCDAFREGDPTILARMQLGQGDIIVGVRGKPEFYAMMEQDVADFAVWVDRPNTPVDPTMDFDEEDVLRFGHRATILMNDGDVNDLQAKVADLVSRFKLKGRS